MPVCVDQDGTGDEYVDVDWEPQKRQKVQRQEKLVEVQEGDGHEAAVAREKTEKKEATGKKRGPRKGESE